MVGKERELSTAAQHRDEWVRLRSEGHILRLCCILRRAVHHVQHTVPSRFGQNAYPRELAIPTHASRTLASSCEGPNSVVLPRAGVTHEGPDAVREMETLYAYF